MTTLGTSGRILPLDIAGNHDILNAQSQTVDVLGAIRRGACGIIQGSAIVFGASYQIARVWGIPVKVHISLILLLLYVGMRGGIAVGSRYGLVSGGLAVLVHMALMALVFLSVALHELGHSYVAIRKGCRVRQITLMIIGGAAQMERIPSRPRDEFLMAIAGPLVSLMIGLLTLGLGFRLNLQSAAGSFLGTLGFINLLLAGFNLLPAFPMDGGRILRAALTPRMGRLPATYAAAQVGKWVAILMGLYGIVQSPRNWILVAIAFFIYSAAGAEYRMMQVREAFRSTRRFFGGVEPDEDPDCGPADAAAEPFESDDTVIVGPPPYRQGPAQRVDIHRDASGRPDL